MRDPIVTTSTAMRAAIDAALADPSLTLGQARVLLAVLRDTGCWSRLSTTTCRARLADAARVSVATVSRALQHLADLGAVVWRPSRARRAGSVVALVTPHPDASTDPVPAVDSAHAGAPTTEDHYSQQGGRAHENDDVDDRAWVLTRRAAHELGATPDDLDDGPGLRALDRRAAAALRAGVADEAVWDALTAAPAPPTVWTWSGLLAARLRTVDRPRTVDVASDPYRTTPATYRSTAS